MRSKISLKTLVWVYEWPKPAEAAAEPTAPSGLDAALSLVAELAAHGLITVEVGGTNVIVIRHVNVCRQQPPTRP